MAKNSKAETDDDVQVRLSKILAGAFSGSPTPLKDIPKKTGGLRGKSKSKKGSAKAKPPVPSS